MSVILTGKVFNDLSHTGIYSPLYPGIPYVLVTLIGPDQTLLTTQTDHLGTYTFYGLSLPGDYLLLETTYSDNEKAIPPTLNQPLGLNGSTTVRKYLFTLTLDQIAAEVSIDCYHFGHNLSDPFSSTELTYLFSEKKHTLHTLDLITGHTDFLTQIDFGETYSLLGFNPLDYFIYGYALDTGRIIRLSADGLVTTYSVSHLPHKQFTVGDITPYGHLYLYEPLDNTFFVVDVNPYSPTYMHLLDPHNQLKEASSSVGYAVTPLDISTCCFNPYTNLFYTLDAKGHLISINVALNQITFLTTIGTPSAAVHMMIADYNGYLYCLFKDISFVYRLTCSDTSATSEIFSPLSMRSTLNGVRCQHSPTYITLGSAPDTSSLNGPNDYSTSLVHNGPRHGMTNILSFGKEDLSYLEPTPCSITDTSYKLTLPITNHTGKDAYLYGWIDFNRNGVFELHECIEPLFIPHTLKDEVPFSLSFKVPENTQIILGDTYIRLRLTTDKLSLDHPSSHLEDPRSVGPASDGQVIDLPLMILALAPISEGSIKAFCEAGQKISGISQIVDPCGGELHYKLTTAPQHGLAQIHPHTGHWDYRPYENFLGEDTFILSATSSRSHLSTEMPLAIAIQKAALKVTTVPIHSEFLIGDTVTYTTTVENIGTVPITDLLYTHPLSSEVSFVLASVSINNTRDRSASPEHGIILHRLAPGEICIITFKVLLTSPSTQYLSKGILTGAYAIASKQGTYTQEGNLTKLTIKSPNLSLDLSSNVQDAFLEDTLQYTFKLTNSGDLPLEHIKVMLALPPELGYDNHLTLNHLPVSADLCLGYSIKNLAPSDTVTLQFTANVLSTASSGVIKTTLFTSYTYSLNEEIRVSKDLPTQCDLTICIPHIQIAAQFDREAISLGELFTYTLTTTNHSDFLIEESLLKTLLPKEVQILDIHSNKEPLPHTLDTGLSLGKLLPLDTTRLTVKLKLLSIPDHKALVLPSATGVFTLSALKSTPNKVVYVESSALAPLPITDAALHLHKSISTPEATVGETVTYTLTLTNSGTISLNQVTIRDLLCPELKFITDSIVLNGKNLPHTSLMSGILIDNLLPAQTQTLSFNCMILDKGNGILENTCSAYYTYKPHHANYEKSGSTTSNTSSLIIHQAQLSLSGTVNQSMAYLDDKLFYSIEVTNNGDMDVFNVFLNIHLEGAELIDGTFTLNHLIVHSISLSESINIGAIPKGQSVLIHYQTKVTGHCHFEDSLVHTSSVAFAYTTMDHYIKYDKSEEFDLTIPLALSTFKQLSLDNFLEVPCHEPDMELINTIGGQVSLLRHYTIDTPVGISPEGQKLSGKKLIVHALLELTVEYVAGVPNQPIHSIYYTIPFSTFIILPTECHAHSLMHIDATIENVSYKVLNNRSFFTNSSILLVARIK